VAGLVGIGLSRLWAASKLEDPSYAQKEEVSNSMGLFLQKTNIIRDYLEDLDQGRTWWPEDIWSQYSKDKKLSWFKKNSFSQDAVACLNHMVLDALELVPACLEYLSLLKDPQIFRFCAIPQVMAMATLAECYNNKNVFRRVCKIRKGMSAKLMIDTNDMAAVKQTFNNLAAGMLERINTSDPSYKRTRELLEGIVKVASVSISRTALRTASLIAWVLLFVSLFYFFANAQRKTNQTLTDGLAVTRPSADFLVTILMFSSLGYLFGFFGLSYI